MNAVNKVTELGRTGLALLRRSARERPLVTVGAAAVTGAVLMGLLLAPAIGSPSDTDATPQAGATPSPAPPTATPSPTRTPILGSLETNPDCPRATVTVDSTESLSAALEDATAGDVISMVPGVYTGNFVATASGTENDPIVLCGLEQSVLDGDDPDHGYVFHLDGASYWHLLGFTVTNGQKGVMADGTVGSVLEDLTVTSIGDEAIHLRNFSTDNRVIGNTVSQTGLRKPKFGEGVYIGTAQSNWCDISSCRPDHSDRNEVIGNTFFDVTAEGVDVKEGTTGGIVRDNSFDGSMLADADSWVDVQGNDWLVEGNEGINSTMDGFQTHEILDGWGTDNTFRDNTATVNGPGFGYSLTPELNNVVECSNTATAAGEGVSNVDCR